MSLIKKIIEEIFKKGRKRILVWRYYSYFDIGFEMFEQSKCFWTLKYL
jgi:hypothetical protein